MTFAPPTIKAVRALLKGEDPDLDDNELGIVGGPSHIAVGTSYHLGADQLIMSKNPYSARTARDKAGLSNAASALDIDDDLDELRELSVWLVAECRKAAVDTLDIREVIFSPDGINVLRWDRERGVGSAPVPDGDLSHRTHTHISWYRDSEFRDKTAVFKRFFGDDMDAQEKAELRNINEATYALLSGAPKYPAFPANDPAADQVSVENWVKGSLDAIGHDVAVLTGRPPVTAAPVDPAALKAVLLDPEVLAAIADAVLDEQSRRTAQ